MKYHVIIFVNIFLVILTGCRSTNDGYSEHSQEPDAEIIQEISSYQTNLTETDIATFFKNNANRYLAQADYYFCNYFVFYSSDEQNYAWSCFINKRTFKWGIIYDITLFTNNGFFYLLTSNTPFDFDGHSAKKIITFRYNSVGWGDICADINKNILAFLNEMGIAAKMNNSYISDATLKAFQELNFIK
jgi:hypothetical protein